MAVEIRIMANGVPNQMFAAVTAVSAIDGSDSQCTGASMRPMAARNQLTTPYSVANCHFHRAPMTSGGSIQPARNRPRM